MSVLSQFFSGADTNIALVPIEIFMVGGGGGGAGPTTVLYNCGGGAGQVLYTRSYATIGKSYTLTIGAGGSPSPAPSGLGGVGNATIFGNYIAYGGGGGISYSNPSPTNNGSYGSAGGGGGVCYVSGNTISDTGFSAAYSAPLYGGGGAGGVPTPNPNPYSGPNGGNGIPADVIGIPTIVGGGGGPGSSTQGYWGSGGPGGGGNGAYANVPGPQTIGASGTANTGGGGGGGAGSGNAPGVGGSGGSGLLIIRYPTSWAAATVTGNTPTPAQPGYNVYRWNSGPGTITFNAS